MSMSMVERVLKRIAVLKTNPRRVSLDSGLNQTFVRDLVRRPDSMPSATNLEKLAATLKTTPHWLVHGDGAPSVLPAPESVAAPAGGELRPSAPRRFVRPIYGGVVEAGPFRPVEDFDDDPEREIPDAEEDARFPGVPVISFDVAGDSMNALQPTPLLPGQRVLAIEFEGLKNRVPLRNGMVVVVEQVLQGGHLRERSVKQIEMHRDRTEFCPRSTNPKHKPIVVPFDMQEMGGEDGREVKVLAIVRQVVSDLPQW